MDRVELFEVLADFDCLRWTRYIAETKVSKGEISIRYHYHYQIKNKWHRREKFYEGLLNDLTDKDVLELKRLLPDHAFYGKLQDSESESVRIKRIIRNRRESKRIKLNRDFEIV